MTKIFIDGEAGTTGLQIRNRLLKNKQFNLIHIPEQHRKNPEIRKHYLNQADIVILCLPDEAAKESVSMIENGEVKIIDASSAHRVNPSWTYGFPELDKNHIKKIKSAMRISNPGCYPQGLIALIHPLIIESILPPDFPISYNAISGYTGGGHTMIKQYESDPKKNLSYRPYALNLTHKHLAEMQLYSGLTTPPLFQPSIGNFPQGLLGAVPLNLSSLNKEVKTKDIFELLNDFYTKSTFIHVKPLFSNQNQVELNPEGLKDLDEMHLYIFANEALNQILLFAQYDNLGKGASGSAIQNLNIIANQGI